MSGSGHRAGLHALVEGRVQGVGFRASTVAAARRLGLGGWVRNLPDGRVELKAWGDQAALAQLREWLRQGPPFARVDRLDCVDAEPETTMRFELRR